MTWSEDAVDVQDLPSPEGSVPSRRHLARMSHARKTFAALLVVTACLPAAATAAAPAAHTCHSSDLRYPFQPGGPKAFGVFRLQISHGRCVTAHRVAAAWMTRFEAAFRAGRVALPRSVAGFTFTRLPVHVAQTYRERGRARSTTIWFDYRIPNG
jgi:hypothetical protein